MTKISQNTKLILPKSHVLSELWDCVIDRVAAPRESRKLFLVVNIVATLHQKPQIF